MRLATIRVRRLDAVASASQPIIPAASSSRRRRDNRRGARRRANSLSTVRACSAIRRCLAPRGRAVIHATGLIHEVGNAVRAPVRDQTVPRAGQKVLWRIRGRSERFAVSPMEGYPARCSDHYMLRSLAFREVVGHHIMGELHRSREPPTDVSIRRVFRRAGRCRTVRRTPRTPS